ncbi:hypothetical protein [Streptomyces prunicolor]|uniref:hypothetical protein n=1 Tax=Streptomyces prunicolor TaxID=67348 RepID=UPI00037EFC3E|nr:hypothetical protein [Streptomyces prunicolor]
MMMNSLDGQPPVIPPVCYWVEEEGGTRWLVPGCMSRMHDPDIERCDCPVLAEELSAVRRARDTARRDYRGLRWWTDSILAAVHARPDGIAIMKSAAERAVQDAPHSPR